VLGNKKYMTSLAEMKRIWRGEEGRFEKGDLIAWFRVFNQTQLQKTKGFLHKT
jgi:hypothetical protein